MYSFRKRSIFRRPATVFASGLFMLALYPTVGAAALPDACTEPVDVPARVHTMFTLSCTPSPAALDQQINAEDLGDNAAYGQTWLLYQRPDPSSRWSQLAATDELVSGTEYNFYSLNSGRVEVAGSGTGTGPLPPYQEPQDRMIFITPELSPWEFFQMYAPMNADICGDLVSQHQSTNPAQAGRKFVPLQRLTSLSTSLEKASFLLTDRIPIRALLNVDGTVYTEQGAQWLTAFLYKSSSEEFAVNTVNKFPKSIDSEENVPVSKIGTRVLHTGYKMNYVTNVPTSERYVVPETFAACANHCSVKSPTAPQATAMFTNCQPSNNTRSYISTVATVVTWSTPAMPFVPFEHTTSSAYAPTQRIGYTGLDMNGNGYYDGGDYDSTRNNNYDDGNALMDAQCNMSLRLVCIEVPNN